MFENQIPERNRKRTPPSSERGGSVIEGLKGRFRFRHLQWKSQTGFQGGPTGRARYQITLLSWMASFIDGLFLLGLSSIFLLVFAKIVQSPAGEVLRYFTQEQSLYVLFAESFVVVSWFYLILLRSFFGFSIGEWACDLRLGFPYETKKNSYIPRVIFRSTITILTGIITLPILSLLYGVDIAGSVTGLRLLSLK